MTRKQSLPITEDRELNAFLAESTNPEAAATFARLLLAKPLPESLRAKFALLDVPAEVLEAGKRTQDAAQRERA